VVSNSFTRTPLLFRNLFIHEDQILNTHARMTSRTGINSGLLIIEEARENPNWFEEHKFSQPAPPMRGIKRLPAADTSDYKF
jgi:hypothetical protein